MYRAAHPPLVLKQIKTYSIRWRSESKAACEGTADYNPAAVFVLQKKGKKIYLCGKK